MNTRYSLNKINDMAAGDQAFVTSLVTAFLEEVPKDLDALEKAIQARDYQQVYLCAHKIKPNVAILDMEPTRRRALDIETLGKQATDIAGIETQFLLLKEEILRVLIALQKDFSL